MTESDYNQYPEPIRLAQQAKKDFANARRRYHTALRECLPPGTPIQYIAHNGRKYNGVIVEEFNGAGYVMIKSDHTQRTYPIGIHFIEGLA